MLACTPNIGPRQRRRRLHLGIAGLTIAVALAVALIGEPPALRPVVFVPLLAGWLGVFQYLEKT